MLKDTTVISFRQPDAVDDPLTELAREGARRMLAQALIAEADAFVALWKDLKLPDGRDRAVRHGHGPQRAIQTGVGLGLDEEEIGGDPRVGLPAAEGRHLLGGWYGFHCKGVTVSGVPLLEVTQPATAVRLAG